MWAYCSSFVTVLLPLFLCLSILEINPFFLGIGIALIGITPPTLLYYKIMLICPVQFTGTKLRFDIVSRTYGAKDNFIIVFLTSGYAQ